MISPRYWRIRLFDAVLLGWVALILLGGRANAQAVRFDEIASTTSAQCASGKQCPLNVLPGTTVNFCSGQYDGVVNTSGRTVTWVSGQVFSTSWTGQISINGTSQQIQFVTSTTSLTLVASVGTLTGVTYSSLSACLASAATTYTDFTAVTPCSSTAQLTPQTGGACLSTANNQGEFGAWLLPGQYSYYLRVPVTAGGGTYGPYPINVGASSGCPLGGTCDANYQTLAAACTAAGAGTLYVTRNWPATPTQSLGCALTFLGNGKITTAISAVVTITGTITAPDRQRIFDTSANGSSVIFAVGAAPYASIPWWGGDCVYTLDSTPAIKASLAVVGVLVARIPSNCTMKTTGNIPVTAAGQVITGGGVTSVIASNAASFDIFTPQADDQEYSAFKILGSATTDATTQFAIFTAAASPALRVHVSNLTIQNTNDGIKQDTGSNSWTINTVTIDQPVGKISGTGYGILGGQTKYNTITNITCNGTIGTNGRHCLYFTGGSSYNTFAHIHVKDFNNSHVVIASFGSQPSNDNNIIDDVTATCTTGTPCSAGNAGSGIIELSGSVTHTIVSNVSADAPGMPGFYVESINLGATVNANNQIINMSLKNPLAKCGVIYGAKDLIVSGGSFTGVSDGSLGVSPCFEISTSGNVVGHNVSDGTRFIGTNVNGVDVRSSLLIQNTAPLATNTYTNANNWVNGTNGTNGVENGGGALIKSGINLIDGTTLVSSTINPFVLPGGYMIQGASSCVSADSCIVGSGTNNNAVLGISGDATGLNQAFKIINSAAGGGIFTIGENAAVKVLSVIGRTNSNAWHYNDQAAANGGGGFETAFIKSSGTRFTVTGCSANTTAGGATAGSFVSRSSATCTFTVTMGGASGLTAATGWTCSADDITTGTHLPQTASTTTSCSFTGATTTGDKVQFMAISW